MRTRTKLLTLLGFSAIAILVTRPLAGQDPDSGRISLMDTLLEWRYPEAAMLGATMKDGGNPEVGDMTCHTIFTTPAPFDDVVRFYEAKTNEVPRDQPREAKAVVDQDDSKGRPMRLRVVSIHKANQTDTLVISRASVEALTHVAWSQYRHFPGPGRP
jgi:hypothetical protein